MTAEEWEAERVAALAEADQVVAELRDSVGRIRDLAVLAGDDPGPAGGESDRGPPDRGGGRQDDDQR
jgi:hypothetical protein